MQGCSWMECIIQWMKMTGTTLKSNANKTVKKEYWKIDGFYLKHLHNEYAMVQCCIKNISKSSLNNWCWESTKLQRAWYPSG